jgi:hypothetical protein
MLYTYMVRQARLTDDQLDALQGQMEVISAYAPREIRQLLYFDCQFPNGDVYPLAEEAIDITSCIAV